MCDEDRDDIWICSSCIGESWLRQQIAGSGEPQICHYCEQPGACFSLETIADLTETAIGQHYVRTADAPSDMEYARIKFVDGWWERDGEAITDVIQHLLITSSAAAQAIQALLEERHLDWDRQINGEECEFASDSQYTERRNEDTRAFEQMWDQFVHSLKTESRYINTAVLSTLDEIFNGITGISRTLFDAVLNHELDAAFIADAPVDDSLERMVVYKEELVIIAPANFPPIRSAADLIHKTLLVFSDGCSYRDRLTTWFREAGLRPYRLAEMSSYHAILGGVSAGMGAGVIPTPILDTFPTQELITVHPFDSENSQITTELIWRKGERTANTGALIDILSSTSKLPDGQDAAI